MDCCLPGLSVHGIFQAKILEQVAISSPMGSSWLRDWSYISCVSCISRQFLYHWAIWEAQNTMLEGLTENNMMEMSVFKPGEEEEIQQKQFQKTNWHETVWQKGSDNSKLHLRSFTTWTLLWHEHTNYRKCWKIYWYCMDIFLEKWNSKNVR